MLNFRHATIEDIDLIFRWSNDPDTRKKSYNPEKISYKDHIQWFHNQLKYEDRIMLIFEEETSPVGLVRFKKENNSWVIGINISKENRGRSFASQMLKMSVKYMFNNYNCNSIIAYIKKSNLASIKAFEKAGFKFNTSLLIYNVESYQYKISKNEIR